MASCLRVRRRKNEKIFKNWATVERKISDCGEGEGEGWGLARNGGGEELVAVGK